MSASFWLGNCGGCPEMGNGETWVAALVFAWIDLQFETHKDFGVSAPGAYLCRYCGGSKP